MTPPEKIYEPARPEAILSSRGGHGPDDDGIYRGPGLRDDATVPDAYLFAIKLGMNQEVAAAYAGVTSRTVANWMKRGAEELDRLTKTKSNQTPRKAEKPYFDFLLKIISYRADGIISATVDWRGHFKRDWRAIQSFTEQHYTPEGYGPAPTQTQLTGPGGGPVQIAAAVLTLDEAEALLQSAEARGRKELAS